MPTTISHAAQQPATKPFWRLDRDAPKHPAKISADQRTWARSKRGLMASLKAQHSNQLPTNAPTYLKRPGLRLSITISPATNLDEVISHFQNFPNERTSVHTLSLRFSGRAPRDQAVPTEFETSQAAAHAVELTTLLKSLPRVRSLRVSGGKHMAACALRPLVSAIPRLTSLHLHSLTTSSADLVFTFQTRLLHLELNNVDTSDGAWTPIFATLAGMKLKTLKLVDLCCHPTRVDDVTGLFVHRRARFEDVVDLAGREEVAARLREAAEWAAVGSLLTFDKAGKTKG